MTSIKLALLATVAALAAVPASSNAATITVGVTNDERNTDGDCSLREAVQSAQNDGYNNTGCVDGDVSALDTIVLPGPAYALTLAGDEEDGNDTGDLDIGSTSGPLVIRGLGSDAGGTHVSNSTPDRIFDVLSGNLALQNLIVEQGNVTGAASAANRFGGNIHAVDSALSLDDVRVRAGHAAIGGGVYTAGTSTVTIANSLIDVNDGEDGGGLATSGSANVTVTRTLFDENAAENDVSSTSDGGGIRHGATAGSLTLIESELRQNYALNDGASNLEGARGAGIYSSAPLTITRSLFAENTVESDNGTAEDGGGLYDSAANGAAITNSTFYLNLVDGDGGAIYSDDPAAATNVRFSTLRLNNAISEGKTFYGEAIGDLKFAYSIIESDTITPLDICGGDASGATSGAYNVSSNTDSTCNFVGKDTTGATSLNSGFPINSGGPTKTIPIAVASPAVDKVPLVSCSDAGGVDQRGFVRYTGAACDAGAYEFGAAPPASPPPGVTAPLPSNAFLFGKVKVDKKKGTATIEIKTPGAGVASIAKSKALAASKKTTTGAATVKLTVKTTGKSLRKLKKKKKLKVSVPVTFTPAGGQPKTTTKSVTLKRK